MSHIRNTYPDEFFDLGNAYYAARDSEERHRFWAVQCGAAAVIIAGYSPFAIYKSIQHNQKAGTFWRQGVHLREIQENWSDSAGYIMPSDAYIQLNYSVALKEAGVGAVWSLAPMLAFAALLRFRKKQSKLADQAKLEKEALEERLK